jgi:ribosomal protein L30E
MQDSFPIGNNLNPNEGNKLKKPSFQQSCDISKMKYIEVKENIKLEVKEELDREAMIHEAKIFLYEEL